MSIKKWTIKKLNKDRASKISEQLDLPFFLAMLLDIRGITDNDSISEFLNCDKEPEDPMKMKDMDKAVSRINRAIDSFEKICIYGDYDADGVTATVLLYSYLESIGANVMYYIPKRDEEGYGLNIKTIDKLKEYEISLIVTVDNGIVAIDEVEYAKSIGIDTVITDHHQPREQLPNAVAVVDPHRKDCESSFKLLAGVGVAFKLVMALEGDKLNLDILLENYSDLVAIGTVGDMVPLNNENRFFVKCGINYISNTDKAGLKALLKEAGIYGKKLSTSHISYTIVPRINASGRIDSSERAVQLLLSDYQETSDDIALCLGDENRRRQKIEQEIMMEVEDLFKKEPNRLYEKILVIAGEGWHQGVIGIVASRITEKYGKPSIVISSINGMAKGSGRSIEGFSLYDAICSCSEHLTRFGGHPMAAGINLESNHVEDFKVAIENYARNFGDIPTACLNIDCKLNPAALSIDLVDQISDLEPFGFCNAKPLFVLSSMVLDKIYEVGGGKHLRLRFVREGVFITAMKFSTMRKDFPYNIGDLMDLAVTIDINEFSNEKNLSIVIRDCKLTDSDFEKCITLKRDFEKIKRGETNLTFSIEKFIPTRNEFAVVYRYLKKVNEFNASLDILEHRIGDKDLNFGKIAVILDIMRELSLINYFVDGDNYNITLNHVENKVNLQESELLKRLYYLRGEQNA